MSEIKKKKPFDADIEADLLLEKQLELKDKSGFANVLTAVLCFGFIFVFAVLFWIVPDKEMSESENRVLAGFPEFTRESFLSGDFTADFATYMADQFPVRDFFVGVKAVSETVQLKNQNNDIFVTGDGYLIDRNDYFHEVESAADRITAKNIEKNIGYTAFFEKKMDELGIQCVTALVGRKQDVYTGKLPNQYGSKYSDELWEYIENTAKAEGLDILNLRSHLAGLEADGLYYRTDHHWTTDGAYEAYVKIMEAFGDEPFAKEDFYLEAATDEFYGTTYQAAGVKWIKPDTINYYRYEGDEKLTLRILDAPNKEGKRNYDGFEGVTFDGDYAVFSGLYVRDYLKVTDKYSSFIGGNNPYCEIVLEGEERETLVIAKDSFAHSIAPFLARHYDLAIVDFRSFQFSVKDLCEAIGADKALVLCNAETLGQGSYLKVLRAGKAFDEYTIGKGE